MSSAWWRVGARPAVALCAAGVGLCAVAGALAPLRLLAAAAALAVLVTAELAPWRLESLPARAGRLTPARAEATAMGVLLIAGTPTSLTIGYPVMLAGAVLYARHRVRMRTRGRLSLALLWIGRGHRVATLGLLVAGGAVLVGPWHGESQVSTEFAIAATAQLSAFGTGHAQLLVPLLLLAAGSLAYAADHTPADTQRWPRWLPLAATGAAWCVGAWAAVGEVRAATYVGGVGGSYYQDAAGAPFLFCAALLPMLWLAWRRWRTWPE